MLMFFQLNEVYFFGRLGAIEYRAIISKKMAGQIKNRKTVRDIYGCSNILKDIYLFTSIICGIKLCLVHLCIHTLCLELYQSLWLSVSPFKAHVTFCWCIFSKYLKKMRISLQRPLFIYDVVLSLNSKKYTSIQDTIPYSLR